MDINSLSKQFAIENRVKFVSGKGGWNYVHLENNGSTAFISLYGGHVLHYTPKGQTDLLWNTEKSYFEQGKPIRGGVPLCFPWFGPHASDSSKPMHGFARLSMWDVKQTRVTPSGETELVLTLSDNDYTRTLWPYSFQVIFTIRLGSKLELEFNVLNTGKDAFTISEALHTYFQVGNSSQITIEGLEGCTYYDGTNNNTPVIQKDKHIEIHKEENRRYINTSADCILTDLSLKRKVKVEKKNSHTTVVWNPWIETARAMADMHDDGYKTFVCIEAANAFDNSLNINPGQSYMIGTSIGVIL